MSIKILKFWSWWIPWEDQKTSAHTTELVLQSLLNCSHTWLTKIQVRNHKFSQILVKLSNQDRFTTNLNQWHTTLLTRMLHHLHKDPLFRYSLHQLLRCRPDMFLYSQWEISLFRRFTQFRHRETVKEFTLIQATQLVQKLSRTAHIELLHNLLELTSLHNQFSQLLDTSLSCTITLTHSLLGSSRTLNQLTGILHKSSNFRVLLQEHIHHSKFAMLALVWLLLHTKLECNLSSTQVNTHLWGLLTQHRRPLQTRSRFRVRMQTLEIRLKCRIHLWVSHDKSNRLLWKSNNSSP